MENSISKKEIYEILSGTVKDKVYKLKENKDRFLNVKSKVILENEIEGLLEKYLANYENTSIEELEADIRDIIGSLEVGSSEDVITNIGVVLSDIFIDELNELIDYISYDQYEEALLIIDNFGDIENRTKRESRKKNSEAKKKERFQLIYNLKCEGLTHKEIADRLGISLSTVKRSLKTHTGVDF